jgi:hypothetical protein
MFSLLKRGAPGATRTHTGRILTDHVESRGSTGHGSSNGILCQPLETFLRDRTFTPLRTKDAGSPH